MPRLTSLLLECMLMGIEYQTLLDKKIENLYFLDHLILEPVKPKSITMSNITEIRNRLRQQQIQKWFKLIADQVGTKEVCESVDDQEREFNYRHKHRRLSDNQKSKGF